MTTYIIKCLRGAAAQQGVACEIQPEDENVQTLSTDDNGLIKLEWDHDPSRDWRAEVIDPLWNVIGQNPVDVPAPIVFYTFNVVPA